MAIREQLAVSQGVFARLLNVPKVTEISWEKAGANPPAPRCGCWIWFASGPIFCKRREPFSGITTPGVGLVDGGREVRWTFKVENKGDMSATVSVICNGDNEYRSPTSLRFLLPAEPSPEDQDLARRLRRLSYLTAERVGPREAYPLEDPSTTQIVGPRGETAASLLHWGRDEKVVADLVLDSARRRGCVRSRHA